MIPPHKELCARKFPHITCNNELIWFPWIFFRPANGTVWCISYRTLIGRKFRCRRTAIWWVADANTLVATFPLILWLVTFTVNINSSVRRRNRILFASHYQEHTRSESHRRPSPKYRKQANSGMQHRGAFHITTHGWKLTIYWCIE